MVQDVRITDSTLPKWATEQTLSDIKDLAQTGVQWEKGQEKFRTKEAKNQADRVRGLGKQFDKSIEKQKNILSKVFSGSLSKIVKGTIVGGASLETVFKKMAQTGIDLLDKIPIVGAALVALVGIIYKLVDVVRLSVSQYLELFDTGVILNGRFLDLMHISATAGISIMQMTDALKTHSETIVRLSTENNKGGFAFAELSRSVVNSMLKINMLGLSLNDVNEYFLDYLDIQRMAGSVQQLNTQRTTDHFVEYMRQLSLLSRVTGIQRKQIQEQINEALRDDSFNAKLAGLGEDARAEIIKSLMTVTPLGPAMVSAFKDEFVFGAQGISESARGIVQFMPEVSRRLKDMVDAGKRGEATDAFVFLEKFQQDSKRFIKTYGDTSAMLGRLGNDVMTGATVSAQIGRQMDTGRMKQQAKLDAAIESFTLKWDVLSSRFSSQFLETAALILEAFEDSGLFEEFFTTTERIMRALINFLEQDWNPFIERLKPGIEVFGKWIETVLGAITPDPLEDLANAEGGSPLTKISEIFTKMVDGMLERFEYGIDRLINNLTPFGMGGTSKPIDEWRMDKENEERRRQEGMKRAQEPLSLKNTELGRLLGLRHAKGGIARVPSIFGEAGAEVAIPLPDGSRIPVAEVKRPASEMKTFDDIRSLLEDIKDRIEFTAQEAQTQSTVLKQIERKTGKDSSRIF